MHRKPFMSAHRKEAMIESLKDFTFDFVGTCVVLSLMVGMIFLMLNSY